MKIFSLEDIRASGCPNLWHDALSLGQLIGAAVTLDDETAAKLLGSCPENSRPKERPVVLPVMAAPPKPVAPAPKDKWPAWVNKVALLSKPGDKGIGDVIARTVGPIGGDAYKAWFQKVTGRPCGCSERQKTLNEIYPLDPNQRM